MRTAVYKITGPAEKDEFVTDSQREKQTCEDPDIRDGMFKVWTERKDPHPKLRICNK